VFSTIPKISWSRKTGEYMLIASIILLGVLSFGLGRLSANPVKNTPITQCEDLKAFDKREEKLEANVVSSTKTSVTAGAYVGSKNGSVYHLPWCSGAKRIQEENKIWFNTKEEAESAGYRPATNCKGI